MITDSLSHMNMYMVLNGRRYETYLACISSIRRPFTLIQQLISYNEKLNWQKRNFEVAILIELFEYNGVVD